MKKKTILIISVEGIGDQIIRRPFMFAARKIFKNDKLILATLDRYKFIFGDIGFDALVGVSFFKKENAFVLTSDKFNSFFDIIFDLSTSNKFEETFSTLNYDKILFFSAHHKTKGYLCPKLNYNEPRIIQNFRLLVPFSNSVVFKRPKLSIESSEMVNKLNFDKDVINIGIFPFSSSDRRSLSIKKFLSIINYLSSILGSKVVFFIIGDQKDKGSFFDNTKKNWVNLIGKTSIKDFFYLVNKMDFIVCNESAPAHIADEFEIPLLAFFIPDSGSRYHPISKSSRVIVSESEVDSIPLEVITSELDKILKRIKHENN